MSWIARRMVWMCRTRAYLASRAFTLLLPVDRPALGTGDARSEDLVAGLLLALAAEPLDVHGSPHGALELPSPPVHAALVALQELEQLALRVRNPSFMNSVGNVAGFLLVEPVEQFVDEGGNLSCLVEVDAVTNDPALHLALRRVRVELLQLGTNIVPSAESLECAIELAKLPVIRCHLPECPHQGHLLSFFSRIAGLESHRVRRPVASPHQESASRSPA